MLWDNKFVNLYTKKQYINITSYLKYFVKYNIYVSIFQQINDAAKNKNDLKEMVPNGSKNEIRQRIEP